MCSLPPLAARRPASLMKIHGVVREDPYYWMRERENPEVRAYLEVENAYAEAVMEPLAPFVETLYDELLSRIEEDYQSAPYRDGDYFYYYRLEKGKDYRLHCRRRGSMEGAEEIYLDENELAEGEAFLDLGFAEITADARVLALAVDTSGDENFRLIFKDLISGRWLPDTLEVVSGFAGVWDASGEYFFYVLDEPETQRPHRLVRHRMGTPMETDVEIFEEPDPLFYLGISESQDRKYLFLTSESKQTTEAWFLRAETPLVAFACLIPRVPGIRYYPDHHEGRFVLHTNFEAENFQILAVSVDQLSWEASFPLVPSDPEVYVIDYLVLREHLVVFSRREGQDQVWVFPWTEGQEPAHVLEMPEAVYVLSEAENAEYDSHLLNLEYSSPITPTTVWQIDLRTNERKLLKRARVPGHNPSDYVAERRWVESHDGAKIPLTIVRRRDCLEGVGGSPGHLYAYGAYGETSDPSFSRALLNYLERGVVCAIAHVRGGGLLGEPWYLAGKLDQKKNSFADFVACAEYLRAEGLVAPDRLSIEGGSAGGLLVGAVINERPELFAAAVAEVPFVDVVTTMLDETIPLTTFEWEEWGDPRDEATFHYLLSYSPYDQVRPQRYPALFVTAGLNDSRVQYWEPAKWVARLRATALPGAPLIFSTHMDSGHSGASARYEAWREIARQQAFVLHQLGIEG